MRRGFALCLAAALMLCALVGCGQGGKSVVGDTNSPAPVESSGVDAPSVAPEEKIEGANLPETSEIPAAPSQSLQDGAQQSLDDGVATGGETLSETAQNPLDEEVEHAADGEEPTDIAESPVNVEITAYLDRAGVSLAETVGQLVIVEATGAEATVSAYERTEEGWSAAMEPVAGHVGRKGVTDEKTEGDGKTPTGLYTLTEAFGIQSDPGSGLPYRSVTAESFWVDDPNSKFYNQWVEGTGEKDWSSAEPMGSYTAQYAYGAVVDYNRDPIVPGAGSAIFLHCGNRGTAGCVSVPTETMKWFLCWFAPEKEPSILIL